MTISFSDQSIIVDALPHIVALAALLVTFFSVYWSNRTARSVSNAELNRRRADKLTELLAEFLSEAHDTMKSSIHAHFAEKHKSEDNDEVDAETRSEEEDLYGHHHTLINLSYELQIMLYKNRPDEKELIDAIRAVGSFLSSNMRQIYDEPEDTLGPDLDGWIDGWTDAVGVLLTKSEPVVRRLTENL